MWFIFLIMATSCQRSVKAQFADSPCIIGLCEKEGEATNGSTCIAVAEDRYCLVFFDVECKVRILDTVETNITNLECIDVGNLTEETQQNVLYNQREMFYLDLQTNGIKSLQPGVFSELQLLYELYLNDNNIEELRNGTFAGLGYLNDLYLNNNDIKSIEPGSFSGLDTMIYLYLVNNKIYELQSGVFNGLSNLRQMELQNNRIVAIENFAFNGTGKLNALNMTNNRIQKLQNDVFHGLQNLMFLELNNNDIYHIEADALVDLTNLRFIFLLGTKLQEIHPSVLNGLSSLEVISTTDNRFCCLVMGLENVTCARASSSSPLDTCGSLFPSIVLRIAGWAVGLTALIGNSVVIFMRICRQQQRTSKTQHIMIISLAFADCLMGIYMIIITSADVYFGEFYFLSAPLWRESILCQFSGFLSFLSSESSVFILTLITIDRCLCILFPFGQFRISTKVAIVTLVIMWMSTFCLSALPLVLNSYNISGVYGQSDVCIGLPLHVTTEETGMIVRSQQSGYDGYLGAASLEYVPINSSGTQPSWAYSVAIFIGLNCVLFIILCVCYVVMFIKVKRSTRSVISTASQQREIRIARKMAFLVGTDFLCWMPIIIMGILSQTGLVTLPSSLYAWCVIFIVPINSAINPVLYTFIAYLEKRDSSTKSSSSGISRPTRETNSSPKRGYSSISRDSMLAAKTGGSLELKPL